MGRAGEEEEEKEEAAADMARAQLQEQRDENVHSFMAKVQVLTL